LSDEDIVKLRKFANYKLLGGRVSYAEDKDLLHEAIVRTLDGRRQWNQQKVDLVTHLKGCMSSIADEWWKGRKSEWSLIDPSFSIDAEQEHEIRARQALALLRKRLRGDVDAMRVFECRLKGSSAAETRQELNISAAVYEAARKKLSRRVEELRLELKEQEAAREKQVATRDGLTEAQLRKIHRRERWKRGY
jgi:hypothetical protein